MFKFIYKCSFAALIIGCSVFSLYGIEHGPYGRYTGPNSLGPFSVNSEVSVKSFLNFFGVQISGKDVYCFKDEKRGIYLYGSVSENGGRDVNFITLSTFPNCENIPVYAAQIDPAVWKTPEGIGISSDKADVEHAYGKPIFVKKLEENSSRDIIANPRSYFGKHVYAGDTSYLYSCRLSEMQSCLDDLRVTRIGFDKGKVIWIQISNSE